MGKSRNKKLNAFIPVDKRQRQKNSLKSPFSALGDSIQWSSWKDEHLPNILWACVLAGNLDRDKYLTIFRKILANCRNYLFDVEGGSLCHNFLSTIDEDKFRKIFNPVIDDPQSREIIRSLTMLESLPDSKHWQVFSEENVDTDTLWKYISQGVFLAFDHQSQNSTDIRWLKLSFYALTGRLVVGESMSDIVESLRLYPNHGDMRRVRPTIRAMEMSTRAMETGAEKPDSIPNFDAEAIWEEFFQKTSCFIISAEHNGATTDKGEVGSDIEDVISNITRHFSKNITNTNIDARLDSSFGLTLYALSLVYEISSLESDFLASGRIILRSIVENFITLRYLRIKDNPTIWLQYRNYGSGQTALAFLKNLNLDNAPTFIDMDKLEMLANEDAWFETKDINLGAWAGSNLRKMSEEAGIKDVYDQYYDVTSGFVHGHWGAVRDTTFTTCLNPLHRLHRVPHVVQPMPPVLIDCCKIANRILDEISSLYPPFSQRIQWKKFQAQK